MITRAIYIPDIIYNNISPFELQDGRFVCTTDYYKFYPIDVVLSDSDWLVVSIDPDDYTIENKR